MTDLSTSTSLCVCGHDREAHTHFRRGTDCSLCRMPPCPRFRSRANPLRRMLRAFRRRP